MPKHGNSNPSPATRFKEGNAGGKPGRKTKGTLGNSVAAKLNLEQDERPLAFFLKMMAGKPFKMKIRGAGDGELEREVSYFPTMDDMKWGAAMAAPYMHPKLSNIEHSGNVTTRHEDFIDKLAGEDTDDSVTRH